MIVELATMDDLPVLLAMRTEASAWLRERGVDQWRDPWPNHEAMVARIAASIRAGETWVIRENPGDTIGSGMGVAARDDRVVTVAWQ